MWGVSTFIGGLVRLHSAVPLVPALLISWECFSSAGHSQTNTHFSLLAAVQAGPPVSRWSPTGGTPSVPLLDQDLDHLEVAGRPSESSSSLPADEVAPNEATPSDSSA